MGSGAKRNYARIAHLLKCDLCESEILFLENLDLFRCEKCPREYLVMNGVVKCIGSDPKARMISKSNMDKFGEEWEAFSSWGFRHESRPFSANKGYMGTLSETANAFESKIRPKDIRLEQASAILDAGCGNGRFLSLTADSVSEDALVVGVDIGEKQTSVSFTNNEHRPNVFIIQASLLELPLRPEVFDSIYSNGVLMHTGNAREAFSQIAKTLRPDGFLSVNVYGKLNPLWEILDFSLRQITVRLTLKGQKVFSKAMANIGKAISKIPRALAAANLFVRLQPSEIHMFDWYAAPFASHHTWGDVAAWFAENELMILDDHPTHQHWYRKPWAVNIVGQKDKLG